MTQKNLLYQSFGREKGYNILYHKTELFLSRIIFTLDKYGQKSSRGVKKELCDNISRIIALKKDSMENVIQYMLERKLFYFSI